MDITPGQTTTAVVRRCRHCGNALSPTSEFCSRCGSSAEQPGAGLDPLKDKLQALFGSELEFQQELGRGGMAAVFLAFDPGLQRRVAVKALLPDIADEPGMAERFLREARTVASLQHPHVVTVYSVRSNAETSAIVMQYVEGRSLEAALKERSPLPLAAAGMVLVQTAEGLQHAHERGVVHRDVKPANVLLDHAGRAVVSDFGIARRDNAPRTTETGMVVGTWAYMSPEQRRGEAMTAATDQYSFGVMGFELLTGRLPFTGTLREILRAHLEDPPPSLIALRGDIPQSVEALVHRMMAKKPEERYASLREAQRAFAGLVSDEGKASQVLAGMSQVAARAKAKATAPAATGLDPSSAPTTRVSAADGRTMTTAAEPAPARVLAPAAARSSRIVALGGAALMVVAVGVWGVMSMSRRTGTQVTARAAPTGEPTGAQSLTAQAPVAQAPIAQVPDAKGASKVPSPDAMAVGGAKPPKPVQLESLVPAVAKPAVTVAAAAPSDAATPAVVEAPPQAQSS